MGHLRRAEKQSTPLPRRPQRLRGARRASRGRVRAGEVARSPSWAGPERSDAGDARSRDRPPARSRHAVPGGVCHLQVSQIPDP